MSAGRAVRCRSVVFTVITLFLSLCSIVALLEVFIRLYASKVQIFDLEEWKYAKYLKRTSEHPLIGHEHVPNTSMILQGVDVSINALGFRSAKNSIPTENENTVRIALLGDSMTFGWGAPFDCTFGNSIEKELNQHYGRNPSIELINMGVGNYNTVMEVEAFRLKGMALSPSIAVLNYFINDAEPIPRRSDNILLDTPLFLPVVLWSRIYKIRSPFSKEYSYAAYYQNLYSPDQRGWKDTQKALADFFVLCEGSHITPLVSIIPDLHDVSDAYPFKDIHREIMTICLSKSVRCVDVFPHFKGKNGRDFWASKGDPHLNCLGHSIVAGALVPALRNIIDESIVHGVREAQTVP